MTAPDAVDEPAKLVVSLHIENHYELHGQIDTDVTDVEITAPPVVPDHDCKESASVACDVCEQASDGYYEWSDEQINQHTGTGREDGDASYFVKVTASSDEALLAVGTEFEFGV